LLGGDGEYLGLSGEEGGGMGYGLKKSGGGGKNYKPTTSQLRSSRMPFALSLSRGTTKSKGKIEEDERVAIVVWLNFRYVFGWDGFKGHLGRFQSGNGGNETN